MRIAVDCREMEGKATGVGRYLTEVLARLPREAFLRHEFILYFKSSVPRYAFLNQRPFQKKVIGSPYLKKDLLWEIFVLPHYLKKDGIELLWAPIAMCSLFKGMTRKITTIHDLTFLKDKKWFSARERWMRKLRLRWAVRSADFLMTNSDHTRQDLERLFPKTTRRTKTVYQGCDHAPATTRSPKSRAHQILYVGSILNRRGVDGLVRSVGILQRKYPDIVLRVIGDNRTHPKMDFEALIRSLSLEKNVFLSGFSTDDELNQAYGQADIFCFPSLYEGFGITILEAQRHGIPVVTLKNSCMPEIMADSVRYAKSPHPEDIARSLDELLSNVKLREELARKGLANSKKYGWSKTSEHTLQIMEAVA